MNRTVALALGLVDNILSSAGGVQLDTMYWGSGFGKLGEGRQLVGIISHVAELKE